MSSLYWSFCMLFFLFPFCLATMSEQNRVPLH
uniref:Uncharacterized protein n=1 Tax=Arundo donax TaxID=35708 RepID=A0A0A9BNI8_ARUDO